MNKDQVMGRMEVEELACKKKKPPVKLLKTTP
jgi:hypothetical protein